MVEKLSRHGAITRAFARALTKQVLHICQNKDDHDLFFELDDPVRKVLRILMNVYPRSWWGSIGPLLEPLLPLLQKWTSHVSPAVRKWAQDYVANLKNEIADAARRAEEDPVRFG